MEPQQSSKFLIPGAILVAGALIAGAVYMGGGKIPSTVSQTQETENVPPVRDTDHIRNSGAATLTIVEYSDTECPFCKVFHQTLRQIMTTYGGQVAWVYRQFPIAQLHSKAPKEAEATECVASLGGNDLFWKYLDKIFDTTGSNDSLDPSLLPIMAEDLGIDSASFNSCLTSGRFASKIQDSVEEAIKIGARGTPYSVIMNKDGKVLAVINGAEPLATVKAKIDALLK